MVVSSLAAIVGGIGREVAKDRSINVTLDRAACAKPHALSKFVKPVDTDPLSRIRNLP
jgi:hypothetical protein